MGKATPWIVRSGSFKIGEFVRSSTQHIVNSTMDTAAWWTMYGSTNIADGVMHCIRNNDFICGKLMTTTKIGGLYKLTYTITNVTSGSIKWTLNGGANYTTARNTIGTYTEYITNIDNAIYAVTSANTVLDIDNVTLVEVDPLPTITKGTKYLECVTAGTIALQSSTAFGTWNKIFYKGNDSNVMDFIFISSKNDVATSTNQNGYMIRFNNDEIFYLYKITNGVLSSMISSAIYFNFIYYSVKITRTTAGVFLLYINDIYIGTATDNTFTSANYIVINNSIGDRDLNIKIINGIF